MPLPRKRILIVDDEPKICTLLSEALALEGYETLTASDGREGLEKAIFAQPDLILLDVMMPGMDGWQMLSCLRREARAKNIPVVMLTARGETESVMRSYEKGVVDYFIKPVDMPELVEFLRKYSDRKPPALD